MKKKLAGTGLALGLVAGAGAGLILERAGFAGATSGSSIAAKAAVDPTTTDPAATADPVKPDPSTRLQEVLKPLVDDGTITQAQADKVIAALDAARPPGGPERGGHRGPGPGLDIVATTLGITADEVRTALQSGQSIADLAVSKGKTAQNVIDAIVQDVTTKTNAAVTAKKLTQAEADQRLADLTTRVTQFVNSTPPLGGPKGPGGFGGRGGPGFDGDDDAAPVDPTATPTTVTG